MYTEGKRVVILIAVASLMNLLLFLTAYCFNLPLWMDTTGTIYAALILGFPAGFIVAIINNVTQALFFYGLESLQFYLVSALTALVTGIIMTRFAHRPVLKWFILTGGLWVLSSSLAVILTFVAYNGIPADYWGNYLYHFFLTHITPVQATVLSVGLVKTLDVLVSVGLVVAAWHLTPRAIRENNVTIKQ